MNSVRQGVPQLHKKYHLDSCIIRALAFMYDTTIQIASDNFYLFDRRLWITRAPVCGEALQLRGVEQESEVSDAGKA